MYVASYQPEMKKDIALIYFFQAKIFQETEKKKGIYCINP